MGKLGKVEEMYLVVMFGRDVVAEVLLEHAIDLFDLPIGLWMEGCGEVELCPK